jgi:hypothetical protein
MEMELLPLHESDRKKSDMSLLCIYKKLGIETIYIKEMYRYKETEEAREHELEQRKKQSDIPI